MKMHSALLASLWRKSTRPFLSQKTGGPNAEIWRFQAVEQSMHRCIGNLRLMWRQFNDNIDRKS